MENGSTLGTWLAYAAIVLFLVFLLALVIRTMGLFATLTIMPISRVGRWFLRLFGRGGA
ncbi:MAG TPA: hypothetical protein VIK41_16710 [Gemmatimonadaceae bacterium]|jgi:hypothetical protein